MKKNIKYIILFGYISLCSATTSFFIHIKFYNRVVKIGRLLRHFLKKFLPDKIVGYISLLNLFILDWLICFISGYIIGAFIPNANFLYAFVILPYLVREIVNYIKYSGNIYFTEYWHSIILPVFFTMIGIKIGRYFKK